MGREALCIVMGTRSKLPDGSAGKLLRLTVNQEPTDLPDGPYDLLFHGRMEKVRRKAGSGWLIDSKGARSAQPLVKGSASEMAIFA